MIKWNIKLGILVSLALLFSSICNHLKAQNVSTLDYEKPIYTISKLQSIMAKQNKSVHIKDTIRFLFRFVLEHDDSISITYKNVEVLNETIKAVVDTGIVKKWEHVYYLVKLKKVNFYRFNILFHKTKKNIALRIKKSYPVIRTAEHQSEYWITEMPHVFPHG